MRTCSRRTHITGLLHNQIQVTAKTPGITQLFASVSGTTSAPLSSIHDLPGQVHPAPDSGRTRETRSPSTTVARRRSRLRSSIRRGRARSLTRRSPGVRPIRKSLNFSAPRTRREATPSPPAITRAAPIFLPPALHRRCNIGVLPGLPIYSSNVALSQRGTRAIGVISASNLRHQASHLHGLGRDHRLRHELLAAPALHFAVTPRHYAHRRDRRACPALPTP